VVDCFIEYPTLASGIQSALRRLPDVERLLPRAARALAALQLAAGADAGTAASAGSQEGWVEGDGEAVAAGSCAPPPAGGAGAAQGRQPAWRVLLQQRQQQQQHRPAAGGEEGAVGDAPGGVWAGDAQHVGWRAVRQLPLALSGLVETMAVLRRQMAQVGLSSSKFPPIQKGAGQGSRCQQHCCVENRSQKGATHD
jgi:hypothetical protein